MQREVRSPWRSLSTMFQLRFHVRFLGSTLNSTSLARRQHTYCAHEFSMARYSSPLQCVPRSTATDPSSYNKAASPLRTDRSIVLLIWRQCRPTSRLIHGFGCTQFSPPQQHQDRFFIHFCRAHWCAQHKRNTQITERATRVAISCIYTMYAMRRKMTVVHCFVTGSSPRHSGIARANVGSGRF